VIRIKFYSQYGYGQYPNAVVFDKIDIVRILSILCRCALLVWLSA
jgi:hypothetical protein